MASSEKGTQPSLRGQAKAWRQDERDRASLGGKKAPDLFPRWVTTERNCMAASKGVKQLLEGFEELLRRRAFHLAKPKVSILGRGNRETEDAL